MLTPTFNSTYTVKLVILLGDDADDAVDYPATELAKSLQALYDQDVAPAGFFDLEKIGSHLVVTLERSIGDDAEVLGGRDMDEFNVVEQLAAEYREAYDNGPEGQFGQTQILTLAILNTLKRHKAVVAGLPCQMVKVRLVCEWVMPAGMTLEQVRTTLHHNRDSLDLISIRGAERELAEFYVKMPGGPIGTYTALDLVNP